MEAAPIDRRNPKKRTRVVASQSKRGCTTCKTRRVKCDEQKPLCRRCLQSGRPCAGYDAINQKMSPTPESLQPALKPGVKVDRQTERLCYLAAHVLSLDTDRHPLSEESVWGCTFLQLSAQVESVKFAAAAFGAAYEALLPDELGRRAEQSKCSAWRHYGLALSSLQHGVNGGVESPVAIAFASMVLSCAEILGQNERNAYIHFQGAVRILATNSRPVMPADTVMVKNIQDELATMNLSIGSYALSQRPQVMQVKGSQKHLKGDWEAIFRDPQPAITAALLCLHRSYQFISSAAPLRYLFPSWRDYDILMCQQQSQAIAECRRIIKGLTLLATRLQPQLLVAGVSVPRDPLSPDTDALAEVYAMRTQLTASLIYLLCIHSPFQTAYDAHVNLFQDIIRDAAASARLRRRTKLSALKRFSTRPGILAPLLLVAIKCRDPTLREVATAMMSEHGREGPVDGKIMAVIAARMAEIEAASSSGNLSNPAEACDILEVNRVHGYGVSPPRVNEDGRSVVDVVFSRARVPLEEAWGCFDFDPESLDSWGFWTEPIEVP